MRSLLGVVLLPGPAEAIARAGAGPLITPGIPLARANRRAGVIDGEAGGAQRIAERVGGGVAAVDCH